MIATEKLVTMTRKEFDALLEYSCSLPTGTKIGKRWKRNDNAFRPRPIEHLHFFNGLEGAKLVDWPENWWMGEYTEHPNPKRVGIVWRKIVVL